MMKFNAGMKSNMGVKPAKRRLPRPFLKNERGHVAIEFGLLAAPFLGILLSIVEVGMFIFASQEMETALADTSRLIRTGQATGMSRAQMIANMCQRVILVPSQTCQNGLQLEVKSYPDFVSFDPAELPLDNNGDFNGAIQFQNTSPGDIVIARAYYKWASFIPNFGIGGGNLPNGDRLIVATAAFRNEP